MAGFKKPDSQKRHLVLDLETFAIAPNATITEIGIVDILSDDRFYVRINPDEMLTSSAFSHSQQTIEWHLKRDPNYVVTLGHCGMRPDVAAGSLSNWLKEKKIQSGQELVIWTQGIDFDIPIITNFLQHYGYPLEWKYNDVRDIRTLAAFFPNVEYKKGNHSASEDSFMAAQYLRKLAHGWPEVRTMLGLNRLDGAFNYDKV